MLGVTLYDARNNKELTFLKTFDIDESFLNDKEYKDLKNDYFTYKKDQLISILSNAAIYFPMIQEILEKEGLPSELVFVAMAESSFKNRAYSSRKAVGIWQFMPATAKLYGLRVDEYIDERRDPIKSTYAAIKYLKTLKKKFGKWYLAMMAYNCGDGRLNWAIRNVGDDSLASLLEILPENEQFRCPKKGSKHKCQALPKETREYIRKILAMTTLTQNEKMLSEMGALHLLNRGTSYPMADVQVKAGTSLAQIAESIDMSEKDLKALNASLKYNFVPPYVKNFNIYIPYDKLADFKENFKPSKTSSKYVVYKVKKGDTLGGIGHKFGIGYKVIKDFNNLKSNTLSLNKKLIIPITKGYVVKHKVKNGDTLISIAKKYDTTVDKILEFNNKKEKTIYVGESLEIRR